MEINALNGFMGRSTLLCHMKMKGKLEKLPALFIYFVSCQKSFGSWDCSVIIRSHSAFSCPFKKLFSYHGENIFIFLLGSSKVLLLLFFSNARTVGLKNIIKAQSLSKLARHDDCRYCGRRVVKIVEKEVVGSESVLVPVTSLAPTS